MRGKEIKVMPAVCREGESLVDMMRREFGAELIGEAYDLGEPVAKFIIDVKYEEKKANE